MKLGLLEFLGSETGSLAGGFNRKQLPLHRETPVVLKAFLSQGRRWGRGLREGGEPKWRKEQTH